MSSSSQPTPTPPADTTSPGYIASLLGFDQTARSATETSDVVRNRLTNLRETSREATLGALDAPQSYFTQLTQRPQRQPDDPSSSTEPSMAWNQIRPIRDALQFFSDSGLSDAVSDHLNQAANRAGEAISDHMHRATNRAGEMISDQMHRVAHRAGTVALDQILSISHVCEPDPRDTQLNQALQSGQCSENSSEIYGAMKKYHIVCFGKEISPRSNEFLREKRREMEESPLQPRSGEARPTGDAENREEEILTEPPPQTQPRSGEAQPTDDAENREEEIPAEPPPQTQPRSTNRSQSDHDGISPLEKLVACDNLCNEIRDRHGIPSSSTQQDPLPAMPERTETPSVYGNRLQTLEETTDQMIDVFIRKMLHFSTMIIVDKCCGNDITPAEYQNIIEESLTTQTNPRENYVNQHRAVRFRKIRHFFRNLFYKMIYSLITPLIDKVLHQLVDALRDFLKNEGEINAFIKEKFDDASVHYTSVDDLRVHWLNERNGEIFERYLQNQPRNFGRGRRQLDENEVITAFGDYIVSNHIPKPRIPIFGRVAHWMRKFLVRRTLNETRILQRIFERGTHSILSAQLELKRMLNERLEDIADMVDRSRVRRVAQLNNEGESPDELALQREKNRLISPELHGSIDLHSNQLLKFSDIIACNGVRERLARVDTPPDPLISRVTQFLGLPEFPLREIMSQATTDTTEKVLLSLLKDRECQTEQQLQKVFRILDRSYGGQRTSDRQTEELQRVEQQLFRTVERISSAGVEAGMEEKIKNLSARRHKQIKDFVAKEKEHLEIFITQFNHLQEMVRSSQPVEMIPLLGSSLNQIADYRKHINSTIASFEFKGCYTDVQGDLHNAYAILIETFLQQATEIDNMLTLAKQNLELERQLSEVRNVLENLSQPGGELPPSNHIPLDIVDLWTQKVRLEEQQALSLELASVQREATECTQKIEKIHDVRSLTELIRRYYNERRSREETLRDIRRLWRDPEVRELIPLDEPSTEALYRFLYPQGYFGRRAASAFFTSLQTRETRYQTRLNQLNRQISTLQESVHDDLETIESSHQNILTQLQTRLTQIGNQLLAQIDANSTSIQAKSTQASNKISNFSTISDQLQVKGYISVGELHLYQTLEPLLVNHFAPRIRKVIQTLINALNDDVHYKDLLLRIGFAGIANRYRESQE